MTIVKDTGLTSVAESGMRNVAGSKINTFPADTRQSSVDRAEFERRAYMRFLSAARGYWAGPMFVGLRRQIESMPREQVEVHPTYQIYAWFERHLQRMRYSGHRGLVAGVEARREQLLAELDQPLPPGLLELDEDLSLPEYFVNCDIHQQPGGVAANILSAHVYREATQAGVVGVATLHQRFAQAVLNRWPGTQLPKRILDLGCGFGRSTLVYAEAVAEARAVGVDLSASCVTLAAHSTPEELRPRVQFVQADAVRTHWSDQSFDLVTSTMLLHEMPEAEVRGLIKEAGRLLAPGGVVAHLDFLPPEDPLLRLLYEGHASRNNEPYLLEHSRIDIEAAYRDAGFASVEILEFAETDDALAMPPKRWRLPWKIIFAVKSEEV